MKKAERTELNIYIFCVHNVLRVFILLIKYTMYIQIQPQPYPRPSPIQLIQSGWGFGFTNKIQRKIILTRIELSRARRGRGDKRKDNIELNLIN